MVTVAGTLEAALGEILRHPVDLACANAPRNTSFSKNDPSRMARVMRITSWSTMRPAPMFWCPTSLLPITPAGNPTSSPEVLMSTEG